ncbi:MAG: response regulator [Rudaea sp.]|uniref:ATP-binding protein n=1 Tax=unclassified Rudaea TaxID=2627037 RepID=UPI0010F7A0CB|nr:MULTISPECIES: ATP-binding protein [unclassified Rudaea]MBN8885561.1 response regulator [Rudaea sp.]MBR0347566.1 response regulator [Rudaea sp.]
MGSRQPNAIADPVGGWASIRRFLFDHSVVLLAVLLAAMLAVAFWYLRTQQEVMVSSLTEEGTRLQAETLETVRSLYTAEVVEKIRDHGVVVTHDHLDKENAIPLPATLTIELGERLSKRNSGLHVRLYSDYPFPWRKDGGARDAFEREALTELTRSPDKPFFRFEEQQGQRVLRYAVADVMQPACIGCHNTHPSSPKTDWKVGDVRGVLEITRSITPSAFVAQAEQTRALAAIGGMGLLSLIGLGLVLGKQRRDADMMRQVAANLSAMDDASPVGTFVTDAQGYCTHLNQESLRITGYTSETQTRTLWSAGVHADDRERVESEWRDAVQRRENFAAECRFQRGDGAITWVSCKAAPMVSGGRLIGYAGTLEDIANRKQVEQMKNEFVSTVSHELRTPLTSIMGALGLLAGGVGGSLSTESKTLVDIAHKNSERLVRLINDILDIEKIESGRMHFDLRPVELSPLVEQAIAANQVYAKQLGVTFAFDTQYPHARANIDSDRLMQVLTNLMGNAAKFSSQGSSVEIRLSKEQNMVRFEITDHGSGIPESFRDKIFSKFSQADSSDARQKGGTGLGLSISKAIIEAMGGSIGFSSQQGKGTTFYFRLPEWTESEAAEQPAVPISDQRPRILVVEDDRDIATLLTMMLERAGYAVVSAYNAASARKHLAEGGFAAMTLDLKLPDLDGRAFLQEIRANPMTRDLAVVVVSGQLGQSRQADGSETNLVLDWIAKPIDENRLLDAMKRGIHTEANGRARVLHVEDDADLRHVVSSLCRDVADFDFASTFEEAAGLLSAQRYGLVILDLELPDRSGWDLLPFVDRQTPRPAVLVFSGTELSGEDLSRVTAALVKSHVSNLELFEAVRALTGRVKPDGPETT